MAKSKKEIINLNQEEVAANFDADAISRLNLGRIEAAEKNLTEAKDKLSRKVYAVQFESMEDITGFVSFIENEAQWKEKESLGIIEISKIMNNIIKEGIKDNIVYLQSLPLEASHYFLSKQSGSGLAAAERFIKMLKPFERALESAKKDAMEIQALEKELAAAQQGLDLA